MKMQLKTLNVYKNDYDFEHNGVPPKEYYALGVYTIGSNVADITIRYSQEYVNKIMELLAEETSAILSETGSVTSGDVCRSTQPLALEHYNG